MDMVASNGIDKVDLRSAAASLQDDFEKLLLLFERELAKGKMDPEFRPLFAEARLAAERGLALSKRLAGLI